MTKDGAADLDGAIDADPQCPGPRTKVPAATPPPTMPPIHASVADVLAAPESPASAAPVPAYPNEPTSPVTEVTKADPTTALLAAPIATLALRSETWRLRAEIDVKNPLSRARSRRVLASVSVIVRH